MKFSEDEMKVVGQWTPELIVGDSIPKYNTPISAKENYFRMFDFDHSGKKCEWIPAHCDCVNFNPNIVPDCKARGMVNEVNGIKDGEQGGKDMFGMDWVWVPVVKGSMVKPGEILFDDANDWKEKVVWPDLDSWDWEGCAERNRGIYFDVDRIVEYVQFTGMFERLISFMGMQNALIALMDEDQQDAVKELFDKLADFYDDLIGRFHKWFHIDMFQFHDDWGSQRGPLMSPDTIREMIAPYVKRVVESCHKRGIIFDFHCCGKNEKLVPIMIECGMDQWGGQAVNDFDYIYRNYGDQIRIGITPYDCRTEKNPEKIRSLAQKFCDDYCPGFDEKPFFAVMRRAMPLYREELYRDSRKYMGK